MHVAILLSCRNGQAYLPELLDSLLAQSHRDWHVHWRDDGSSDATVALMRGFAAGAGRGRATELAGLLGEPEGWLGVTGSFLALLRAVAATDRPDIVAFADQDDVWLPEKLARGVAALRAVPPGRPALYCARQILVDAQLAPLGVSAAAGRTPGLLTALTQNIATGCTVMMNQAAALLVAESRVPPGSLHDWWSYLLVAAAGGEILVDATSTVLYRQHPGNVVGAPHGVLRRGIAALRRGPESFMTIFRSHVAALRAQPERLTPLARQQLERLDGALASGVRQRLACLSMPELRRQTWYETAVFACWFAIG